MAKRIFHHPAEVPSPTGRKYWRSLGELRDTPEFRGWLEKEFPAGAAEMDGDGVSRRNFLQLMGASMALAGLGMSGCRRPESYLVPFSKSVEWVIPGKALFYATSMPRRNGGMPLIVETNDGRPTKIEGNPLFQGATARRTRSLRPRSWICTIRTARVSSLKEVRSRVKQNSFASCSLFARR